MGDAVFEWRKAARLSQAELAKRAGIPPTTLSTIESGRNPRPHRSTLHRLGKVLGVSADDLQKGAAPVPLDEGPTLLSYEDARNALAYLDQQVTRAENGELTPEERAELREDLVTTGNAIAELLDESRAVGLLRRGVGMMHRLEEVTQREAEAKRRRVAMLEENTGPGSKELTLDGAREAYEKLRILLRRMEAGEFSPEERRWLFEYLVGTMLAMRRDLAGPEARELYAAYLNLYDRMGAVLERERERAEDEYRVFAEMRARLAG